MANLIGGYILMQVPSNIIVGKIQYPAIYICLAMALWGLISGLMAAVQNFAGLLACRFFLGFIEAVFFPGIAQRIPFSEDCTDPAFIQALCTSSRCSTAENNLLSELPFFTRDHSSAMRLAGSLPSGFWS